jgi:AcrR family transcriptional regulator
MARYRRLDVRIWGDSKFCALTPLRPSGQALFLYLIGPKESGAIPGLINCGMAALAEALRWPLAAFLKHFKEITDLGMAVFDEDVLLLWVRHATRHNPPVSANVIRGWQVHWDQLPTCELKLSAWTYMREFIAGMKNAKGEEKAKAFIEAFDETLRKPKQEDFREVTRDTRARYLGSRDLGISSSLRESGKAAPDASGVSSDGENVRAVMADFSERFKAKTGKTPLWNAKKHVPGIRRILACGSKDDALDYSRWFFETQDRFVTQEARWNPNAFISDSVVNKWLAGAPGKRKSFEEQWQECSEKKP